MDVLAAQRERERERERETSERLLATIMAMMNVSK